MTGDAVVILIVDDEPPIRRLLRTTLPARQWLAWSATASLAVPGRVLAIGYLRLYTGVMVPGTEVLLTGDLSAAQSLIDDDDDIDRLAVQIEERIYTIFVRQAPMVTQLTGLAGQLGAIAAAGPLSYLLHELGWTRTFASTGTSPA